MCLEYDESIVKRLKNEEKTTKNVKKMRKHAY